MGAGWKGGVAAALMALAAGCSSSVGEDLPGSGTVLAAPTGLAGAPLSETQILLTWTDNAAGETAYRVDIAPVPIVSPSDRTAVLTAPANATSAVVPAVPATTYWFRVVAATSEMQSGYSNLVSVTTPPDAPLALDAWADAPGRVDLSWFDIPGETGYRLERSADGGATWVIVGVLPADASGHSDTTAAADAEYLYRLFATGPGGDSAPSTPARTPTLTSAPDVTTAATGADVGRYTSIAVTAAGTEHISHFDGSAGDVLHTSGPPFATALADAGPLGAVVGLDATSIDLDASGFAHIAAYDATNGDLRYATNSGGPFAAVTVEAAGNVGTLAKLRVHPVDGSIHIVYVAAGALRRAVFSGGTWSFETFTAVETILSLAFDLDAAGNAHVAYVRWVGLIHELVYVRGSGGTWAAETVPSGGRPLDVAIAAGGGAVHVAFHDTSVGTLRYAAKTGGTWAFEDADAPPQPGNLGRDVSIALDAAGRVHAAYYDAVRGDLRYARRESSGAWVRRVVDVAGDVGRHAGIAVDGAGAPHVSYSDLTNLALKRAAGIP